MVDETGMPWWVKIVVILVGMAVLAAYIGVSWVVPILTFKDEKAAQGEKVKWGIIMAIFGIIIPSVIIYKNLPKKAPVAETAMNLNVAKGAVVNVNVQPPAPDVGNLAAKPL